MGRADTDGEIAFPQRLSRDGMPSLQTVILHKHVLFRELIAVELSAIAPIEIIGSSHDPEKALEMVLDAKAGALVVESTDGAFSRELALDLFCRSVSNVSPFVLVRANLANSEIEILRDSVSHEAHLAPLKVLFAGVTPP